MPRMWISGCTPQRVRRALQVPGGVDRRAVDAGLEVHVRTEAVARAAAGADDLALADALPHRHADARLVAVAGGQAAGVLDAGVVAVAADPAGDGDAAGLRGVDGRAGRHGDVNTRVQTAPAHAERGDDRAVDGPDQAAGAGADRAGDAGPAARGG